MKAIPKKICGFFAVSFLLSVCVSSLRAVAADDFDAYRKQQRQDAQKLNAEFQEYKEKQDREFADFLKSRWREFDTFRGKALIKEPEPKQIPVFTPTVPVRPVPKPLANIPAAQPVLPPPAPVQPKPIPVAADTLEIMFYGNAVRFTFDPQWKNYRLSGGDKPEAMSAFWTMMSGSKYEPTIQAINEARRQLKLDDWGSVTLWRSVIQALQPERKAEQNMLLWYFLIKSGYDARLGYAGADVHLFVAVSQPVYATKYTRVGDQKYYAVLAADHGDSISSFNTYEASYPGKLKPLDIQTASTGFTKAVSAQRALTFIYKGKSIKLNVPYDRRLVEYLDTFPQSEFELYFNTDGSSLLRQGLLPQLKKYTATMDEEEAVDFLLAFVQKAFAYKTDEDQFGHEKSFFVEESLYFPYNDCKERSVLFAWLVRDLLGIKVIGLLYPGHLTTAVELKKVKPEFSTVEYKGNQFVIADPTYIDAPVGVAMPTYMQLKPTRVMEIQ
jgi:hypothetical protein